MFRLSNQNMQPIACDREELWEIIVEIPMSDAQRKLVSTDIDALEQQIDKIQNSSSFEGKQQALAEYQNITDKLYRITKDCHFQLANAANKLLHEWISPAQSVLGKPTNNMNTQSNAASSMAASVLNDETLEFRSKLLYAEQSYIVRQEKLSNALQKHLKAIKDLLIGQKNPHYCYIVYAPPTGESKEKEYWVQAFLYLLYEHLTIAGIRVKMDIRDLQPGENIYRFLSQYSEGNDIILIGTESLNYCHLSPGHEIVKAALVNVLCLYNTQKQAIYPLLISASVSSAFPKEFAFETETVNGPEGYIATLQNLITWLLKRHISSKKQAYDELWQEFNSTKPLLPQSMEAVEAEIALGYHKKRLEFLSNDHQFLSTNAQVNRPNDRKTSDAEVQIMIDSTGTVQQAYDNYGDQFQRPRRNPDFVPRKNIREQINHKFTANSDTFLVLAGLRGIGKTEMAQDYYLNPSRPYVIRAWFQVGDGDKSLVDQYVEFGKQMRIPFHGHSSPDERAIEVKQWLEKTKNCLLIYDDVRDPKSLGPLLPRSMFHQIIISSTNCCEWTAEQGFVVVDVPLMDEQKSTELIYKLTGYSTESEQPIKQLAKILLYHPLALTQSGLYMAVKSSDVPDYINLYQKYQSRLLSSIECRRPQHKPVWQSFDNDLSMIKQESHEAGMLLNLVIWLAPDTIPEGILKILLNCSDEKQEEIWLKVKQLMMRYSLMQVQPDGLSMHVLVQDIIRSKLNAQEAKQTFDVVRDLIKGLKDPNLQNHIQCLEKHAARFNFNRSINEFFQNAGPGGDDAHKLQLTNSNSFL